MDTAADLASTIFPVVGALAGVWLGKQWERSSSSAAWWRDRRLNLYVRLSQLIHDMVDAGMRASAELEISDRQMADLRKLQSWTTGTLPAYIAEAELICPADVAKAAADLGNCARGYAAAVFDVVYLPSEFGSDDRLSQADPGECLRSQSQFVSLARSSLGEP